MWLRGHKKPLAKLIIRGVKMMNNKDFNHKIFERNKKIEEYNKQAKKDFEKYGGIDLLTKYIMSETLSPIEDYGNVVNIIRSNYHKLISGKLLIIGAYSATNWLSSQNELLAILELMYDHMPNTEKAIIHYLKADNIYVKNSLKENSKYLFELHKSISFTDVPFVNNHRRIAEISSGSDAKKHYNTALLNIQKVYSEDEISELASLEALLNPQSFINEFILGTHISSVIYEEIKNKLQT